MPPCFVVVFFLNRSACAYTLRLNAMRQLALASKILKQLPPLFIEVRKTRRSGGCRANWIEQQIDFIVRYPERLLVDSDHTISGNAAGPILVTANAGETTRSGAGNLVHFVHELLVA